MDFAKQSYKQDLTHPSLQAPTNFLYLFFRFHVYTLN